MADIVDKNRRSEIMRSVKGFNTKPEIIVRQFLHSRGFRYRLQNKMLPGKPDIKLTKFNCLVFVNGCFWHGHENCKIYVMPKTNMDFWQLKIDKNIIRDLKVQKQLKQLGWRIFVVWECELKKKFRDRTLQKLEDKIMT
jgi:DNA mismatch endonuclease (patch repair protein)